MQYICDTQQMLMGGGSHTRWLTAPAKLSALRAPTERHSSPVEVVPVDEGVALPGFSGILKHA